MKKSVFRRIVNRLFHLLARFAPGATSLRPFLHRARGVKIGSNVFIGDDVFIDNEYPECIEIQDNVQISIRVILIAHTRGPGRVVLEKNSFLGPHTIVSCGANRVLTVGEGAVVGPGCVITRNVPKHLFLTVPTLMPVAHAKVPLPLAKTMDEFVAGLVPFKKNPDASDA